MKVNLEDLKRIVLEEAVAMSEADRSSPAAAFDSPAKLNKLRKLALASIEALPIDHPDLERHVNDLMMRLKNAATEEQLRGVHMAADGWHDRARQLMGWIHRGEYEEESSDMTESSSDGAKRKSLKDVLDHFRTEDVVHTMQDAWAGGGDDALNLVAPVDQLKRQTGIKDLPVGPEFMDVAEGDDPDGNYPALPLADELKESVRSLSAMGRFSPEDHLAPHRPISPMKSLVDVILEQEAAEQEAEPEEVTMMQVDPGGGITSEEDMHMAFKAHAKSVFGNQGEAMLTSWLSGQQSEELSTFDRFMEEMGYALDKEDFAAGIMVGTESDVASDVPVTVSVDEKGSDPDKDMPLILGDTSEGDAHESGESLEEGVSSSRWLKMAGIINN